MNTSEITAKLFNVSVAEIDTYEDQILASDILFQLRKVNKAYEDNRVLDFPSRLEQLSGAMESYIKFMQNAMK